MLDDKVDDDDKLFKLLKILVDVLFKLLIDNTDDDDTGRADVKIVRHLTLNNFRGRLIEHFDIMFKRNQLVWPQRMSID